MPHLDPQQPKTIAVETGQTDATAYAAFAVRCRSCQRILSALSRRNLPADPPGEAAIRQAAVTLLASLGCVVGEAVLCSYCSSPKQRGRERYIDLDSWEIRVAEEQAPVARAGWLAWPGDAEGDE